MSQTQNSDHVEQNQIAELQRAFQPMFIRFVFSHMSIGNPSTKDTKDRKEHEVRISSLCYFVSFVDIPFPFPLFLLDQFQELFAEISGRNRSLFHKQHVKCLWRKTITKQFRRVRSQRQDFTLTQSIGNRLSRP